MFLSILKRIFITNWPRKIIALFTAILVWFLVNQSIATTRTIADVRVRIINIVPDKTVIGLLPGENILSKKVVLNVMGNKSVVDELRSTDIEVVINADGHKESWIASIDKRNIVNLNQDIDFSRYIRSVSTSDLYIKLSKLITDDIPIIVNTPIGEAPKGFIFLDILPKQLSQKVSGPEEQVRALKERGLELTLNLNRITEAELNNLFNKNGQREEISFKVPDSWKKITIPFKNNSLETINDHRADLLSINFLKQEFISLDIEIPITIFFPLKYSSTINPQTYSLATNDIVQKKNGLKRLTMPLYVRDVSRLFVEIVKDNLLLIVIAAPQSVEENLHWDLNFIDEKALEDLFFDSSLKDMKLQYSDDPNFAKLSEQIIRSRFRDYLRNLVVYTKDKKPLKLNAHLEVNTVTLSQDNS